jgi:hypothetical protein
MFLGAQIKYINAAKQEIQTSSGARGGLLPKMGKNKAPIVNVTRSMFILLLSAPDSPLATKQPGIPAWDDGRTYPLLHPPPH